MPFTSALLCTCTMGKEVMAKCVSSSIFFNNWIEEIKRSLVNFVGLEKTVTEMVTGCLRAMKSCHI